ncbi:putative tricarboxylic transport membrane protein [Alteribacillus persepolensis]|uniref:Putative tricarboxylic transport membrane protein n=1 Tax=Alteribacillus persepolensis TaxID=568899 RepID=A0A1G8ANC7_9BACI|nr:tripartite tricarboxylate transporter permease [Alteribacillus persepolensis]SDH21780.1 putative tricarboxylic transport membrane protein [Alteribacillus persepolensis]
MLDTLLQALLSILNWQHLLALTAGVMIGLLVGSVPGLSGTLALALMVPITYSLSLTVAVVLLTAIYKASTFAGSLTSIMVGTPGTPAAAATLFDGYTLKKKGEGLKAVQMSIFSSVTADMLTDIMLLVAIVPMTALALMFGAPEFLILVLLALISVASISETNTGSLIKNLISGLIGLFIAMIGMEALRGSPRYTFGNSDLLNGIDIMVGVIGLLCLPEVFIQISKRFHKGNEKSNASLTAGGEKAKGLSWKEGIKAVPTILRGAVVGGILGILPGAGPSMGAFLNYQIEHQRSRSRKDKIKVGKGSIRGVAAAESGNSAVSGANLLPLFSFGIPGDAAAAILIGAFMIHGITPGPNIMESTPEIVYAVIFSLIIANLLLAPMAFIYSKFFNIIITKLDTAILYPIILTICLAAAYSIRNSMLDVALVFAFGVAGLFIMKAGFSRVAIIIGLILGGLTELSFGQTLVMGEGSLAILFERPISLVLLLLTLIIFLIPFITKLSQKKSQPTSESEGINQ